MMASPARPPTSRVTDQRLPAPKPNLRHIESTVYLELAEAAGGEGDFQREIGKLFFPVNTPRFIRLCAGLLERFAHRGLTARHDFDAGFLEIDGHQIPNPFLDPFVFVGSRHDFELSIQVVKARAGPIVAERFVEGQVSLPGDAADNQALL